MNKVVTATIVASYAALLAVAANAEPITAGHSAGGSSYTEQQLQAFLKGEPVFISPAVPAPASKREPIGCIGCGPDLRPFMKNLQKRVRTALSSDGKSDGKPQAGKPQKSSATCEKPNKVEVFFHYSAGGKIYDARIEKASADAGLDRRVLCIIAALPEGEPLPSDLGNQNVDIWFTVDTGLLTAISARNSAGSTVAASTADSGTVTAKIVRFKNSGTAVSEATQVEKPSP